MLKKYHILIVEDEFINSQFVEQVLLQLGHNIVANIKNADSAIKITEDNHIDFIFMDINLEGEIDGILCAKIINHKKNIAIIYMTAFGDSQTIKESIDTNIYGYLVKPFDAQDIEATLAIAIKQIRKKETQNLRYINLGNGYRYDIETKTFYIDNIPINLTPKESQTLYILCNNINQNISYKILGDNVWIGKEISISTIRDTVLRLRKKAPLLNLDNIIGIGYCLKNV